MKRMLGVHRGEEDVVVFIRQMTADARAQSSIEAYRRELRTLTRSIANEAVTRSQASAEALQQVIAHPQGVDDDRERRVHPPLETKKLPSTT
jgi:hypothetical protein